MVTMTLELAGEAANGRAAALLCQPGHEPHARLGPGRRRPELVGERQRQPAGERGRGLVPPATAETAAADLR